IEMRPVRTCDFRGAYGLYQLFAVMRELVDGLHVIVDDPYVLFRIVRIDRDEMGTLQNFVPLGPALDDVSLRICDNNAVLPFRINAERARPAIGWSTGNLTCCATAG